MQQRKRNRLLKLSFGTKNFKYSQETQYFINCTQLLLTLWFGIKLLLKLSLRPLNVYSIGRLPGWVCWLDVKRWVDQNILFLLVNLKTLILFCVLYFGFYVKTGMHISNTRLSVFQDMEHDMEWFQSFCFKKIMVLKSTSLIYWVISSNNVGWAFWSNSLIHIVIPIYSTLWFRVEIILHYIPG